MLKSGSSTQTGRPRSSGTSRTTCRYRGTSGSLPATMPTNCSNGGSGPSKMAIEPICMWLTRSSRCRNDESSGLNRSPVTKSDATPGGATPSGVLAAHGHDLAGHVPRVVAGQEHDDVGDLPRLGPPTVGLPRGELVEHVLGHH